MFGLPSRTKSAPAPLMASPKGVPRVASADRQRLDALRAQSLELVHLLAASLRVDRSLATAIRFAARHAGGVAAEELERLEWAVRMRHYTTVDDGFLAFAAKVGTVDPDFKRALITLHGAEGEPTREGLERRLDRAYDIMVGAEARRREQLTSSLERPATMLFGTAIVLPLVLAALVPMVQISMPAFGLLPVALLLIVAFPVMTLLGASWILGRNFLGVRVDAHIARLSALAALAPPAAGGAVLLASLTGFLPTLVALPIQVAVCVATTAAISGRWLHQRVHTGESGRASIDGELPDLLHTVGSKMGAGRSAEHGLLDAVEVSPTSSLTQCLRGVLFDVIVGRRSLEQAVAREAEALSGSRVFPALRLLASAALRDGTHAGRVVLHLSEFERLRADAAQSLRGKVRAVVDTIRTTVVVFAPLILGITAGMYGLLGRIGTGISGSGQASDGPSDAALFAAIITVYLSIETVLALWFSARLMSERPATDFAKGLARDVPLALALFALALVGSSAFL